MGRFETRFGDILEKQWKTTRRARCQNRVRAQVRVRVVHGSVCGGSSYTQGVDVCCFFQWDRAGVWFGSWDAEADAEAAKARFNKEEERLWENRERKWQHDNQAESAIVVKYEEKMRRQQESRDAAGIAAKLTRTGRGCDRGGRRSCRRRDRVLRVHGVPQDARLHAMPAYVRVHGVCVRDHGGLKGVPPLQADEHGMCRDLYVTCGTLDTKLARGGGDAREIFGRVCAAEYSSVIAPKAPKKPSSRTSATRRKNGNCCLRTEEGARSGKSSVENAPCCGDTG